MIGIPWAEGAEGPDAYHCWSAAAMVQKRLFGRELPSLGRDRATTIVRARSTWARQETPRDGDIVEMRKAGRANHVGVWIGGGILHCQRGAGMCFDTPSAIRLMGWTMRFWTPQVAQARGIRSSVPAAYVPGLDFLLDADADVDLMLAAHRAVPVSARCGETVLAVLARAGIDSAAVVCVLRKAGDMGQSDPQSDPLSGLVDPEDIAHRRIGRGEVLVICDRPEGGEGGSDPLRTILMIAVIAAAAWIAGPVAAGGLGMGTSVGTALGVGATVGGQLVFGVVSTLGNLAISALLPPPSPAGINSLTEDVSPTFSARAQSSVARPGAPVPVQFGRHLHQLDDVSPPWSRFENNVQVIHQLLALGVGEYDLEEVRLGEVSVWKDGALTGNLEGVAIEHIVSDAPVTLIDEAVWTAGDVTGLTLEPSVAIGWHAAIPAGRKIHAVEIDIGFQQLVTVDAQGNNQNRTVEVLVEAQQIDDSGATIGDVITLETLSFTDATRSALRSSHRWFLPEGRYQVRVTRTTAEGGEQTFDTCLWTALKGVVPGGRTWSGLELLAVKVEVGEAFAAQSARQVRAIKTRKLPVWTGTDWSAPQATREIAWAVAEVLRAHGRLGDIDLDELLALHDVWTARGDRFDTIFDQRISFWEALQAVLRSGRAQPDQLGRRIRIWRDAPQPVPRQLFSERNIRRGSLTIRPTMPVSERPDRLIAQYMDEITWRASELAVGPFGGRDRRERYFGITDRAHLAREVSHDLRAARYRSVRIEFDAELENRLLLRGDPIAISHRDLTEGLSIGIDAWGGTEITLSREIDWNAFETAPGMVFTLPDGSVSGPFTVSGPAGVVRSRRAYVSAGDLAEITAAAGAAPEVWATRSRDRQEPLRAVIGPQAETIQRAIVESVGVERGGFATVTCLDDDPLAHDAPVTLGGPLDTALTGVAAEIISDGGTATLRVEAAVAASFIGSGLSLVIEYSTDGTVWLPFGETAGTVFEDDSPVGVTDVRVAAVLGGRGPWVATSVSTSALAAPTGLVEAVAGTYTASADLSVSASTVSGATSYRFSLRQSGALIATLARTVPQLVLSAAELDGLGALVRVLDIELRAIDAAGAAGDAATLQLTNPAPAAPTNVVLTNITVTWDAASEADVTAWEVQPDWTTTPEVVTDPTWSWPYSSYGTIQIRAVDAVGTGIPTALERPAPPPPEEP